MRNKYQGLTIAYSMFNYLKIINPVLIIIFTIFFINNSYGWEYNPGLSFGILIIGAFFAFLAWLFTVIYQYIILLFVQMGKDINEMKNKK
jgi:hypothetical protein